MRHSRPVAVAVCPPAVRGVAVKARPALFLALLLAPAVCLTQPADDAETITYVFDDFEEYTPGVWCGRPEARGRVEAETERVHSGNRAVRLSWDFSACPAGAW